MWFRAIFLFAKSLQRVAVALEQLRDLYRLDLAARGITETRPELHDEVEVIYGFEEPERDL